jgi:hypothetical protein
MKTCHPRRFIASFDGVQRSPNRLQVRSTRIAACIASVSLCAFALPALAQPVVGEIIHHWNLVEVHAGTNTPVATQNGLLEPGEAMRFELTVSFTPAVGTNVNWQPWPPAPGSGTVAGLYTLNFDFLADGNPPGTWSNFAIAPGWAGGTSTGLPQGAISPFIGQVITSGTIANPANPIERIWQGIWTPQSYEPRTLQWRRQSPVAQIPFGGLIFQYGTDPTTGAPLYTSFGAWTPAYLLPVTIIPAPATGIVLAAGSFIMFRRRRAKAQEVAPRGARP